MMPFQKKVHGAKKRGSFKRRKPKDVGDNGSDRIVRMPFGKHKHTPIAMVDADYLQWVLDNTNPQQWLRDAIEKDLRLRERDAARQKRKNSKPDVIDYGYACVHPDVWPPVQK